jgi:hypothetical protein
MTEQAVQSAIAAEVAREVRLVLWWFRNTAMSVEEIVDYLRSKSKEHGTPSSKTTWSRIRELALERSSGMLRLSDCEVLRSGAYSTLVTRDQGKILLSRRGYHSLRYLWNCQEVDRIRKENELCQEVS